MSIKLNPYLKILKHGHGPIRGPTVCKFRERNWGVKISWDCPINNKWSRETVPLIINVFWVLNLLLFMSEKSIWMSIPHLHILLVHNNIYIKYICSRTSFTVYTCSRKSFTVYCKTFTDASVLYGIFSIDILDWIIINHIWLRSHVLV